MRRLAALAIAGAVVLSAASDAVAYPDPMPTPGVVVTDPTLVVRGAIPRYVLASSHGLTHISADRAAFAPTGPFFADVPAWTRPYGNGDLWTPDISYHDGRYWLYYAASVVGSQTSAIGLATSLTAEPGSWTDRGLVLDSSPGMDYNAIDPDLLVDASGRWWLAFGAWWEGLYMVELDPATGNVKAGAVPVHVAERGSSPPAITSASVYRHAGYYYLFAGFDVAAGADGPPASIRVGRATSATGPFVDRNGVGMLSGGGTIVLESHGDVRSPMAPDVVRDTTDDQDLLVYHWYDGRAGDLWSLGMNKLGWDAQGWPYAL